MLEPDIKQKPKQKWLRFAKTGLFYIAIFAAINLWQAKDLLPSGDTSPSPRFVLEHLNGTDRIFIGGPSKHKTIYYFFAPWCTVCKLNSDTVNMFANQNVSIIKGKSGAAGELENPGIVGIALSYSSKESVEKYVKENDISIPVLLGDDVVGEAFKVSAFPTYYIVDQKGSIQSKSVGYTSYLGLWIRTLF